MPEGAELGKQPSKKLRDLGDEACNQYWTARVKLGRGLFFSLQVTRDLGFSIVSAPQMPVEKTDAMGNVREGMWRLVTDHSYPGPQGKTGISVHQIPAPPNLFHHPRPHCPTPEQITRMSLECSAKYPGVAQKGFKHDIEAT